MKKPFRWLVVSIGLALLLNVAVTAATPNGQDIELIRVALDPLNPFPNQQGVSVTLGYENKGDTTLPEKTEVPYRIEVWSLAGASPQKTYETPVLIDTIDAKEGLAKDQSREIKTAVTAPPQEGKAEVRVFLPADIETPMVVEFQVESALPPQISKLFAVLGIFVAMMAIMAAGTEVVVDTIKFAVGMKRKITALEAYEKLKSEIPGKLASLSGDSAVQRFKDACEGIGAVLERVSDANASIAALRAGDLRLAVKQLEEIQALAPQLAAADAAAIQKRDELAAQARDAIRIHFPDVGEKLKLSRENLSAIQDTLLDLVDAAAKAKPADLIETVFGRIQGLIQDSEKQWTQAWLEEQAENIFQDAEDKIQANVVSVAQTLEGLGFDGNVIKSTLSAKVQETKNKADAKAKEYLKGTQALLDGVRSLREDMPRALQDHARGYGYTIVMTTIATAIAIGFSRDPWLMAVLRWTGWIGIGLALVWGAIAWILTEIAAQQTKRDAGARETIVQEWSSKLAALWWKWAVPALILLVGALASGMFSTIQERIHLLWIASGGVAAGALVWAMAKSRTDPVGRIDEGTSLAKELVIQEDKHQKEEARRTGALKVVSLVVGVVLAYYLHIDALELLEGSMPQIATVNRPLLVGTDLTVGILLTGMAATAGSAFWHDQLDRLQSAKRGAESAAKTVQQVRERITSGTQED